MPTANQAARAAASRIALRDYDEATVADLLATLRRHWVIIIATIVLVTVPSALFGLLRNPSYTAIAQIVIESPPSLAISASQSGQDLTLVPPNLETQANIIRSHPMIIKTMEDLNLFDDPDLVIAEDAQAGQGAGYWNSAGTKIAALGHKLGAWWSSTGGTQAEVDMPGTKTSEEDKARRVAWKVFDDNLRVRNLENSYVIEVAFSSSDAAKAAAIANHLAELYVKRRLERKVEAARKDGLWISKQLQSQQRLVLSAERRAAALRSERQFVAGRGAILTQTELEELNRELIRTVAAKAKGDAKYALFSRLRASGDRLDSINEVIASPTIAQLRVQEIELTRHVAESAALYGDVNPRTVAIRKDLAVVGTRVEEEISHIVGGLRNELDALSAQTSTLEQLLRAAKEMNTQDNMAAVKLQEVERDAAAKRTVYEELLRRFQETRGLQDGLDPGARVISLSEVPALPSSLAPQNIVAVGFVFSSLLGCGLALVRQQADRKLRSHRQIEQSLQVPCLGLVPSVEKLERGLGQHDYLRRSPRSAYAQSLRGIYAQLGVAAPKAKVILITSALPREGKTRLAADIAMCAAQDGQRAVLVDFDDYRPMVARNFGLEASSSSADLFAPGGLSVSNLDHALILDQATGIDILPVGSRERVTMPSLGHKQIGALLKELRKRYQCIVIDSPPLLGVSDGRVLATFADATLFAVRWGWTDRAAATAGLQVLKGLSANVVGVVLTQVDLKKLPRYGDGEGLQYYQNFNEYHAG